jgi:hypothetical protein
VRLNENCLEYLVLADVTIVLDRESEPSVITDDRVAATVSDLQGRSGVGSQLMERRARYRNREGGYWVAAADPTAASHAITGDLPAAGVCRAALMTDGVACLVESFGQLDWASLVSLACDAGPSAVIGRVRAAEAGDPERQHWPRFKVSDDATIAVFRP